MNKLVFPCRRMLAVATSTILALAMVPAARAQHMADRSALAAAAMLDSPRSVLQYLANHPGDFALTSFTVDASGNPDPNDPVLLVGADQPLPLASVFKILVLAAYARAVEAQALDPLEPVALGDWELAYLPGSDGGAHAAALDLLGIPADPYGFALDPQTTVPLDIIAHEMIEVSDNAATDYLMARLGEQAIADTIAAAGLTGQEMPLPIVGIVLSWYNHEEGSLSWPRLEALRSLTRDEYAARVRQLAALYATPEWRSQEHQWLLAGGAVSHYRLESAAARALTPKGTAADYASILGRVIAGTFLSPTVTAILRAHLDLELPPEFPFAVWGRKGGDLAGVINDAAYYVPNGGSFSGRARVTVLFINRLEARPWQAMLQHASPIQFSALLAIDRRFVNRVRFRLGIP